MFETVRAESFDKLRRALSKPTNLSTSSRRTELILHKAESITVFLCQPLMLHGIRITALSDIEKCQLRQARQNAPKPYF